MSMENTGNVNPARKSTKVQKSNFITTCMIENEKGSYSLIQSNHTTAKTTLLTKSIIILFTTFRANVSFKN